jgi:hypothetical protein
MLHRPAFATRVFNNDKENAMRSGVLTSMWADSLVLGRWLRAGILAVAAVAVVPAAVGQYCEAHVHTAPALRSGEASWDVVWDVGGEYGGVEGRIAIVVEQTLWSGPSIEQSIATLRDDLTAEGHDVVVATLTRGQYNGEHDSILLRESLWTEYQFNSLSGAILIGDLPYVLYELERDPYVWQYISFPTDAFFMDLDGSWYDDHCSPPWQAGIYDDWDESELEIWVSRIKVDNLPGIKNGLSDAEVICAYLARNHEHRDPLMPVEAPDTPFRPSGRAMLVDNHFNPALGKPFVGEAFGNLESLCTSAATSAAYTAALTAVDRYYFIHYHGHSSPWSHELADGSFSASAYRDLDPPCTAIGFTFSSCSTCDFAKTDNMVGRWPSTLKRRR